MPIPTKLLHLLVCPRHRTRLTESANSLLCEAGHQYPVVNDVPVLLDDGPQTLWVAESSLRLARHSQQGGPMDQYFIDTIGLTSEERAHVGELLNTGSLAIDPVISALVGATNGIAYKHLIGKLEQYPIPDLRLPVGNDQILLDVGCNWGRWTIAAVRPGYSAVGIDPSLGAVLAAKRLAKEQGLTAHFLVGDARSLPFSPGSINVAFSYSVFQHFSKGDAVKSIQELGRVLSNDGTALVQMPNRLGIRCLYHQARRGFAQPNDFEVRYWSLRELRRIFTENIGPTKLSVDCFFGIGLQASDSKLMSPSKRAVIQASEILRKASRPFPVLRTIADSVYIQSCRPVSLAENTTTSPLN